MENLNKFSEQELLDLLAVYTGKYTQYVANREMSTESFEQCKMVLKLLQSEIEARRNPERNEELFLKS